MTAANIICPQCTHEFAAPTKPRSTKQHRREFGIFRAAFDNWPEAHPFRPQSEEHMRHWLEVQAGHCDIVLTTERIKGAPDQLCEFAEELLRSARNVSLFLEMNEDILIVKQPRSIAYDKLPHKEACDLFNKIGEIVYAEMGIDAQQLLEGHARAA